MRKLFIPVLALVLILTGCANDNQESPIDDKEVLYTVSFDTNGGSIVEEIDLYEEIEIGEPLVPTKEGNDFAGWYTDKQLTQLYNFTYIVNQDIRLYAKWEPVQTVIMAMYGKNTIGGFYLPYGITVDLNDIPYNNFLFEGWYSDVDLSTSITSVTGTLDNQTVYMKLSPIDVDLDVEDEIRLETLPYSEFLSESNPVVTITVKDIGEMKLQLFPSEAPNSVNNFIRYVQAGDYSNSTFHRIIETFMIQGGKVENTGCQIAGEFSANGYNDNDLIHERGVISMARTAVNDSATSQFFIVHEKSSHLDGSYAAFGGLISGFNVLDYIATFDTLSDDSPLGGITIESITVELNGYEVLDTVCAE